MKQLWAVGGAIVALFLLPLLQQEAWGWCPALAKCLVRLATRFLPPDSRPRYREEWLAELEAYEGQRNLSMVLMAARILAFAPSTRRAIPAASQEIEPGSDDPGADDRSKFDRRGTVVVTNDALGDPRTAELLTSLSLSGVTVVRPQDYYERVLRRVSLDGVDESWFLFYRRSRAPRVNAAVKRVLDLVAGTLGSLLVCLLAPLVALLVRLDDGGPVFFRQERIGQGGRLFMIWKFRSMRVDASDGPVWRAQDDTRVTRVGRVLRRSRLDQLPEFFNVLKGEMSLVGPRPERSRFAGLLQRTIPFYDRRHLMVPGITGWATVRFGYGDSVTDKWRSHEYDLYYLKHRSLLLDLEILARTALVMVLRMGR